MRTVFHHMKQVGLGCGSTSVRCQRRTAKMSQRKEKKAEVFIPGGHQFVTDEGSFAHSSLVAAGYEFEAVE